MMNRKTGTAFIGVLVLVVLIVALMKNRPPAIAGGLPEVPHEIYTEAPQAAVEAPNAVAKVADSVSDSLKLEQAAKIEGVTLQEKIKNTKLINVTEYRDEVEKNPHATPTKYIESALKLGTLFDTVKTESDATEVLKYYKDCLSSQAPAPLKVSCYSYSKRIADTYPNLKKDFAPLYSDLDPEVRKVVDLTNSQR